MTPVPVIPVKVLVVFYSRYGESEKLALAAGVGAIQARGVIRLRRLADLADEETIARDALWAAGHERMKRDYVMPRPSDAEWADVILVASPKEKPKEMRRYLAGIANFSAKIAVLPHSVLDPVATARAYGKQVTEWARTIKV